MILYSKIFGDESSKFIGNVEKIVEQTNSFEESISKLADTDFPKKTQEFRDRLTKGETLDEILPEAYALVREAAKRNLKERHYDVQLVGGIALHQGKIAIGGVRIQVEKCTTGAEWIFLQPAFNCNQRR